MQNLTEISNLAIGYDLVNKLKPGQIVTLQGERFAGLLAKVTFSGIRPYLHTFGPVIEMEAVNNDWFGRMELTYHGQYGSFRFDEMPVVLGK